MTLETIHLRQEQPGDDTGIRRVHDAAFPTAAEARLVDLLRQAGRLDISLVAVEGGEIVGHVAFSPVTIAGRTAGLGLGPIAMVPRLQRRGIGSRLIEQGLAACRATGVGLVVVLGEPAYYGRFGSAAARAWSLTDEYDGGDAFQVTELAPGAIPAGGGVVQYAPEFGSLG